jgi:lipopolysaccharide biosynthesis protein
MNSALIAQRSDDLATAGKLYDQALAMEPGHPDALHMRGVVALCQGDGQLAKRLIERAITAGLDGKAIRHNLALANDTLKQPIGCACLRQAAQWTHDPVTDEFIAPDDVQLLAYYLPQFHRIAENDAWWGEGFTEWTNVRQARPNFPGHRQPRVPAELGYYHLLDPEARAKQADLARRYGISGFCYYHYWFSGRRLLEQPLDQVLKSAEPDFPFCVFWANENWNKRWDGGNHGLLVEQRHSAADDIAFIEHLLPYFADRRYIHIDGRPLLMIYRADLFGNPRQTIRRWQQVCRAHGLPVPYVVKADTKASATPEICGADASVEFPPHRLNRTVLTASPPVGLRPDHRGILLDYLALASYLATQAEPAHTHFRTVVPDWDNTARMQLNGTTFLGSSPELFRTWLRETLVRTRTMLPPGRRLVFVNAWNEWAEGAYLEPDQQRGRAMLEAALAARYLPKGFVPLADMIRKDLSLTQLGPLA